MTKHIVAIIQGRMGSSRLPGKILQDIGGQPMLARVVMRARRSKYLDQVVVASTLDPSDEPVEEFCRAKGFPVFRGDLYDVLNRYYQAATLFEADVVVRITADCPVLDPGEVDRTVKAFLELGVDFAANRLPPPFIRTTPIGLDTEVCSYMALKTAWEKATEKFEREHVMPYLYDTPGRFKTKILDMQPSLGHLRWTVDTPVDLELARKMYAHFDNRDDFTLGELLEANHEHPEWQEMISGVQHRTYLDVDTRD